MYVYDDLDPPLTAEQAAIDYKRPLHKRVFQALPMVGRMLGNGIVGRLVAFWPHRVENSGWQCNLASRLLISITIRELLASLPPERQAEIEQIVQRELDAYFEQGPRYFSVKGDGPGGGGSPDAA